MAMSYLPMCKCGGPPGVFVAKCAVVKCLDCGMSTKSHRRQAEAVAEWRDMVGRKERRREGGSESPQGGVAVPAAGD